MEQLRMHFDIDPCEAVDRRVSLRARRARFDNRRRQCQAADDDFIAHAMTLEHGVFDNASRYLASLSVTKRRRAGKTYTPQDIVEFVLDQAGYDSGQPLEDFSILDPSCGAGVFLAVAALRLAVRLRNLGVDLNASGGCRRFLHTVSNNIFGVDVDRSACVLARATVRRVVVSIVRRELPADFFRRNIARADYLLGTVRRVRHAKHTTSFIVGNPPYVSTTNLAKRYKTKLRSRFNTARGRIDLYTLFIERAVSQLESGDRLAFITPDKFLISITSGNLRSMLLQSGRIRSIATFTSHRIFEKAATVPCVFVFERGAGSGDVRVLECYRRVGRGAQIKVALTSTVPSSYLRANSWHISAREGLSALADRIQNHARTLKDVSARISIGLATGLDSAFVIRERQSMEFEPEIIRAAIRGRDLGRYQHVDPGLKIVLPYRFDLEARCALLVNIRDYPLTYSHLRRYRELLSKRHCVRVWGKRWYDIHDPVRFDLACSPKILVPDIANTNRFVYDPGQYCPLHSAYYIIPTTGIDHLFLTAVLNSKPIEFLLRLRTPIVKDGFSRYRRQFLAPLPIPIAPQAEEEKIADLVRSGELTMAEDFVLRLFDLSQADVSSIDDFLQKRRAPNEAEETGYVVDRWSRIQLWKSSADR
jgi:Eco57I restriction-modification methylase/restriction endonuclease TaqI-like protein